MLKETEDKVLQEAHRRNKDGADFRIISIIPDFRDGSLAIVNFSNPQGFQETFIYLKGNNICEVYTRTEELIRAYSRKTRRSMLLDEFGFEKILDLGGIAGVIAIIVAITICYIVVHNPNQVIPDVLSNALTVILGFYFGSKVSGNESKKA